METQKHLTLQAMEARRRNARKSTGPRSAAGKRRSARNLPPGGGIVACPDHADSPPLAREAESLLAGLLEAFEPVNPAERLLVEELARLHRRKQRNQEAQEGLIQKNLGKLQRERSEHQRELTLASSDFPYRIVAAAGYFHMDDCPAKFRELSRLLNTVKEDVELGNFSRGVEELLETIYGPSPSMRGARVLGNYKSLRASGYTPLPPDAEAGRAGGAAEDESETARAARFKRASREATRTELLRALEEEKSLLAGKYERYLDEFIPSPVALHRAALVPADDAWRTLIHQEQALDRQIESKTRLLLFMQWVRRSKESKRAALYRGDAKAKN